MKIEIEAKMPLADAPGLERALLALGARRGPLLLEVNTYFDTAASALKAGDEGLRIRVEEEVDGPHRAVTITHKGPRSHGQLKSRRETELVVEDAGAATDLLMALGYHPVVSFEKRRQLWEVSQCVVSVDQLPHLGSFVEIEGPSDLAVTTLRQQLGLGQQTLLQASYISMLLSHLAERRLRTREIRFEETPAEVE